MRAKESLLVLECPEASHRVDKGEVEKASQGVCPGPAGELLKHG